MNTTSLYAAMCSVSSETTVPVITTSIKVANFTLEWLSSKCLVKQPTMEVLAGDTYFRLHPLYSADSVEDFRVRFAGYCVPGFIIDADMFDRHPKVMAYLLPYLQGCVRTRHPEKPFNFIFV